MFISNKICFLELEKTGISSINKYLQDHITDGKNTRPHDYVTNDILNQKVKFIGSIRNPFDWYISRWSYGCMMKNDDSLYKNFVNKRFNLLRISKIEGQFIKKIKYLRNQFLKKNNYLVKLYSDPYNEKNFRLWLKELLFDREKSPLAEHYFFSTKNNNFGYMTFRYLIMFTKPQYRSKIYSELKSYKDIEEFDKNYNFINKFLRVEILNDELEKLSKELNIKPKKNIEIVNPSERKREIDYYYDGETREIVRNLDRFIFKKFNY
jgi:hypothetical protein|tara:strand:+ start:55 stop:849 length:795 start_codon:yes stop_codon:yes gene_type:complete